MLASAVEVEQTGEVVDWLRQYLPNRDTLTSRARFQSPLKHD